MRGDSSGWAVRRTEVRTGGRLDRRFHCPSGVDGRPRLVPGLPLSSVRSVSRLILDTKGRGLSISPSLEPSRSGYGSNRFTPLTLGISKKVLYDLFGVLFRVTTLDLSLNDPTTPFYGSSLTHSTVSSVYGSPYLLPDPTNGSHRPDVLFFCFVNPKNVLFWSPLGFPVASRPVEESLHPVSRRGN